MQDTWKGRPNLTINAGLAWFGNTTPNPSGPDKNLFHSFDFTAGKPVFAALGQTNSEVYPMTLSNWAPRVGVSYQPGSHSNTPIRAGWGLYHTTQQAVNIQYAVVSQYVTINNAVSNTQSAPTYVLGQNVLPSVTIGQITQAQADSIKGPNSIPFQDLPLTVHLAV